MTKFFGSADKAKDAEAKTDFQDQLDLKKCNEVEEARSSMSTMSTRELSLPHALQVEQEDEAVRQESSVLKRLTLKSISTIGKKE